MNFCEDCTNEFNARPAFTCRSIAHWKNYVLQLETKLEMRDEDRDKLDVAEWLEKYEKVKEYYCHGCGRHYEIPTHLNHFTCVCGHRCRMRHLGGTDPDQAVIDAAMAYFGNERSAQLAWIAEVVGGEHCLSYTADDIRKMIRQEMERWESTQEGWRRKK